VAVGLFAGIIYAYARNMQVELQTAHIRKPSDGGGVQRRPRRLSGSGLALAEEQVEGRASMDDGYANGNARASWIQLEQVRGKSGAIVSEVRRM